MTNSVRACIAMIVLTGSALGLSGCGDDATKASPVSSSAPPSGQTSAAQPTSTASGVISNGDPTISGTPAHAAVVGTAYAFNPTVTDPNNSPLTFSIANAPKWLHIDTTTGDLTGTPVATDVGVSGQVVVSVSNGFASNSLPAFSITVAASAKAGISSGVTISGDPAATVPAGAAYSFRPTAADTTNGALTFSITGKPAWAVFDPTTGALSGTPAATNVGTFAQIAISVTDGTSSASLTAFAINVTQAENDVTLSWSPPTQNTNGSNATDLAGYHIYYGATAAALTQVVNVSGAEVTKASVPKLASGTWYFAIAAYNENKVESNLSSIVPVTL